MTQEIDSTSSPDKTTNGSGAGRQDPTDDIFANLDDIRLTAEESGLVSAKEALTIVPIRKPNKDEYVRVHPDKAVDTAIYVDPMKDVYFVVPAARGIFADGVKSTGLKPILLHLAVTSRMLPFLWPISLSEGIGKRNNWNDSAREAVQLAKTEWVRVVSDMEAGYYRTFEALGKLPDPIFPDRSMNDLLRIAFRGRIIDHENHIVVQRRRGLTA